MVLCRMHACAMHVCHACMLTGSPGHFEGILLPWTRAHHNLLMRQQTTSISRYHPPRCTRYPCGQCSYRLCRRCCANLRSNIHLILCTCSSKAQIRKLHMRATNQYQSQSECALLAPTDRIQSKACTAVLRMLTVNVWQWKPHPTVRFLFMCNVSCRNLTTAVLGPQSTKARALMCCHCWLYK